MPHRDPRTYAVIGAALEVHRVLGCGFLDPVYQEALALELQARNIPHRREMESPVLYKGQRLATQYKADFVTYDDIIVELEAPSRLSSVEEAQILNHLKATGFSAGLLINFGAPSLEYRRFVN